ncbi:MAG: ABC transporter substrate-binding protein, partial [Actinomycetota bacterium]
MALVLLFTSMVAPSAAQDDQGTPLVRIALRADEGTFNPFLPPNDVAVAHDLLMLVYDSLFWTQSQVAPDEWLATDAEPSADFRTWTVTLRPDVEWHDGEPFTADDVAFTFQYFLDVGGQGRYGHHVYQHPTFEGATVIDDLTVELRFT